MSSEEFMERMAQSAFGKPADKLTLEEMDEVLAALKRVEQIDREAQAGRSVSCH